MDGLHISESIDLRRIITGKSTVNGAIDSRELKQLKQELLSKTVRYCDKCGYKYTQDDVDLIRMNSHTILFSVKCKQCGSTHVVVAQVGPSAFKVDKAEMLLDLDPKQLHQYFEKGPITYGDVVALVKQLRTARVGASVIVDTPESNTDE